MILGQFYCVSCKELIGLKEARLLFKSGYYTVVYPLGCCRSCCAEQGLSEAGSSAELLRLQKSDDWRTRSSAMIAI